MSFQDLIYLFASSFVALFPVMNPVGSVFIVNGFLDGLDDQQRKSTIKKVTRNALLIGLITLVAGHFILLIFGLAVPIIQLGGGIIICRTALGWLSDAGENSLAKKQQEADKINMDDFERKLFYPLSFPIVLGPGSMSVIFTMMATAVVKGNFLNTVVNYAVIALVIFAMCAILYILLSQGSRFIRKLSPSGSLIINKVIAFITFCIGIQIIVIGISKIFHLTIL